MVNVITLRRPGFRQQAHRSVLFSGHGSSVVNMLPNLLLHLLQGRAPVKRRTGYGALQEMVGLQLSTRLLIPRRLFEQLVRAILRKVVKKRLFIQAIALQLLQEVAEAVLVAILQEANALAQHSKRVTFMDRDIATLLQVIQSHSSLA
ncbi:histone H3-like [Haemaphysalis longicornis]